MSAKGTLHQSLEAVRRTAASSGRKIACTLALFAAGAALASTASAGWYDTNTWADGRLVDVQIKVAGRAAPLYWSPRNDDRRYFQAFAGRNYAVVLKNNSARRVGVLLAVDGINAVNGERTHLGADESMYVLGPYESATIQGWRTSLDDVRRFVFVDERRSYAERTGQANSDMGWIRVLAFREVQPLAWWGARDQKVRSGRPNEMQFDSEPRAAAPVPVPAPLAGSARTQDEIAPQATGEAFNDMPKAKAMQDSRGLASGEAPNSFPGTGWGDRQTDRVRQVEFRAERTATDQLVFRYEYAAGLRALGIEIGRDRLHERDGHGELGFARPPKW